jgi:hypothetical protein
MDREVSPLIIQKTSSQWTTQDPFLAKGDMGTESDTGREKIGVGLKWSDTPYKAGDPIFTLKTADQSVTDSTTLVDDNTLFFTAEANSTYVVSMNLIVYGAGTGVQIKAQMLAPSGATLYGQWAYVASDNWTGNETPAWTNGAAIDTDQAISDFAGDCAVPQSFVVKTAATSGTVKLQFAQAITSATAVSVRAGSFLRAEKVA